MTDQERWMQEGLDKGFVKWFCLNHETGLTSLEAEQIENNDDICINAFRIAEVEQ